MKSSEFVVPSHSTTTLVILLFIQWAPLLTAQVSRCNERHGSYMIGVYRTAGQRNLHGPLLPACVFQRAGYNEDDCGGVTMGAVVLLPGINNKQHMGEWLYSPWSPKTDFWCRDAVSSSLCILAVLPLTVSHAPRIARHATDELKVCQLAAWEGRRERHQKEFIQWVFLTRNTDLDTLMGLRRTI